LGVDLFFVVSGFLITGLITRELDAGQFSFRRFYWRRAKRLLPAAYTVLLVTSISAVFLLGSLELKAYRAGAVGAVTFTANVILGRQTTYFGGSGDLKPVLHMWSLSLEEQFYLLFPFLLWATPARLRRALVICLGLGSLALCLAVVRKDASGAFFGLATRAWELMLGACGALYFGRRSAPEGNGTRVAGLVGVAGILAISSFAIDDVHPRLDALVACAATLLVIWARPGVLVHGRLAGLLSATGDMSYSLYLVHWPVFSFANNMFLNEVPLAVRVGAVALSLLLARLLYRYIERPMHHSNVQPSFGRLGVAAGMPALIVLIPTYAMASLGPARDWLATRRANHGLSPECDYGARFTPKRACRSAERPQVLVWGDSFAMHLVPGLVATAGDLGFEQATRSMCGPVLDLAPIYNGDPWAQDCMSFNRSVLEEIQRASDLRYVIMASQYSQYATSGELLLMSRDGTRARSLEDVLEEFGETIRQVRAAGKKVVVVAPPPTSGVDLGLCVERRLTSLPTFSSDSVDAGCSFTQERYLQKEARVIAFLERLSREADVTVVWPSDMLCANKLCRSSFGEVPLYRDVGHFTYEGSVAFAHASDLVPRLLQGAR
jgi:peptidoglycan/LPS O-acetylase OafA/YrhL